MLVQCIMHKTLSKALTVLFIPTSASHFTKCNTFHSMQNIFRYPGMRFNTPFLAFTHVYIIKVQCGDCFESFFCKRRYVWEILWIPHQPEWRRMIVSVVHIDTVWGPPLSWSAQSEAFRLPCWRGVSWEDYNNLFPSFRAALSDMLCSPGQHGVIHFHCLVDS